MSIQWEKLESDSKREKIYRTPVPGGWLVKIVWEKISVSITFYPDPEHHWKI